MAELDTLFISFNITPMTSQSTDQLLEELIQQQRRKLLRLANELGVHLTSEDILNPQDYPQLMRSSRFNFEDGVLAGLLSAQMALRNRLKEAE